jgi:hypothetical protein
MCYVAFIGPLHYLYVIHQRDDQNSTKMEKSFYWIHDTAVSAAWFSTSMSHTFSDGFIATDNYPLIVEY